MKHFMSLFFKRVQSFFYGASLVFFPLLAFADSEDTPVGSGLSWLVSELTGPIGVSLAALALIGVGLWCWLGDGKWGVSGIRTLVGVCIVFGAPKLITVIVSHLGL